MKTKQNIKKNNGPQKIENMAVALFNGIINENTNIVQQDTDTCMTSLNKNNIMN